MGEQWRLGYQQIERDGVPLEAMGIFKLWVVEVIRRGGGGATESQDLRPLAQHILPQP